MFFYFDILEHYYFIYERSIGENYENGSLFYLCYFWWCLIILL